MRLGFGLRQIGRISLRCSSTHRRSSRSRSRFAARTAPPEETLRDLVGCQEFLQHHRQSVLAGVEAAVAEYFKQPALSSALAERYVAREKDLPRLLSTAASQQMAPKTLAKITDDWVSEQGTIADVDARQLAILASAPVTCGWPFLGP